MSTAQEKPQQPEEIRGGAYVPDVDILEKEDELLLLADMPGAKADEIDVRFEEGTLDIHAKVPSRQKEGVRFLLQEYGTGDYHRTFQVGESIDVDKITAEYDAGVLTLHLPKQKAQRPQKIQVQVK